MINFALHPDVTAFTTTREEGRDPQILCPRLGVATDRFARPHQVHKTVTKVITEEFFSLCQEEQEAYLDGVDAVIYNIRNACIGISTADCIPVIAYDPVHRCAAAIHAGWRGTVARIVQSAIGEMQRVFGTSPSDLRCAIGPGISLESFEVGDEVYDAFAAAGFDMDAIASRYAKWHLDIKECNRLQLLSMGVDAGNIIVSELDTMTDARFYSARRDGAKTGRMLSGIVITPPPSLP